MSGFFDDLETQLHAAAVARAVGRRRARRRLARLPRGIRLAPVIAAVLVPLAVAAIVLTMVGSSGRIGAAAGGDRGPSSPPSLEQLQATSFNGAWRTVRRHDPACAPRGGILAGPSGAVSTGRPSNALLSILGVLRRPATARDKLPGSFGGAAGLALPGVVYVHYIRLARVDAGISYYVVVAHIAARLALPRRCFVEVRSAVRQALPQRLPRATRTRIMMFATQVLRGGPGQASGAYDGVFLIGGSGGVGGAGAVQLERMGLVGSSGRTVYGVVPDGVADVALPLRPLHGYPNTRLIAGVVNNVFVAHSRRFELPTGEAWLSPTGAVIRRINLNR